jgi:hypothetical protein
MATYAQNTDVDAAAEALVGSALPVLYGVHLKALAANTGTVYVGLSDQVTASTGWPLAAGEDLFVSAAECNSDANGVYVIASTTNQAVAYRAV